MLVGEAIVDGLIVSVLTKEPVVWNGAVLIGEPLGILDCDVDPFVDESHGRFALSKDEAIGFVFESPKEIFHKILFDV